ncbi:TRAP transporter substrate-binding protein [Virgibacillus necropolis]|uniref:TRAP transporter substrate-binding protein n=1 Tax=Virgibacillus necropolis TaxID=163877 RepID=UPI001D038B84|nr:TRAP transporter substrate-binding protein [Virgibacillus necropolis]
MSKTKSILMGFFSILIILILVACSEESGSQAGADEEGYDPIEITFSHNQPLDSPEHKGAVKFKELVESKTDGQVTVKIYPSLQLGSLREQVEATQFGEINITMQPSAVVSPFVDDIKVLDLPYLLPTKTKQMYELLDSEVGDELLATLETGGFKGLGFWPGGYKLFTTNGIEIHKPEDFEGVTMRTMEAPILLAQYEEWGGSPIPVPYAELYNALQQGVVDGQENPIQTIFLNNYHEVQDTIIESHHGGMTYILMANLSWFEGLPNSVQNAIIEAEKEARNVAREELVASEDEYRQKIIDSGVNYYELTPEEIEVFREASIPMHEKYYNTEKQLELLQKINDKIDEITK